MDFFTMKIRKVDVHAGGWSLHSLCRFFAWGVIVLILVFIMKLTERSGTLTSRINVGKTRNDVDASSDVSQRNMLTKRTFACLKLIL